MTKTTRGLLWSGLVGPLLVLFLAMSEVSTHAEDMGLEARLIWGTNGDKPNDPQLKDVDPKMREKLTAIFKWRNYYEVHREQFIAKTGALTKVRMSAKCRLEVQAVGQSWIDVKLFGEEKLVVKKRQLIKPGELLVLAGDDKDDTAWFVVMMETKR